MKIREDFLPLYRPVLGSEEISNVTETLKSGWLTTGPKVKKFEENVCEYLGCKKAVALTSCTGGLHISLAALGIGPGDEVLLPTYTFVASAHVVEWLGAKPVLVDVEKNTFNIDPKKIEEAVTDKTKAIMPVHFAGHSCDMDPILKIAEKYNLKIIEDAAHAIGTKYKSKLIGNFGDATVFSFYATKSITTAEGGMVVTNNEELSKKLKQFSYFGVDKDAFNRYSDKGTWYYEIIDLGYKYNMDELQGSLGVEQIKKLDQYIDKKTELVSYYNELLSEVPEIITPHAEDYTFHSQHLYPILLDIDKISISRKEFIEKLREYKIGCGVHFIPLHLHPYYQKKYNLKRGDFPVSEHLYDREVSLPLFPAMKKEDVKYVVDAIKEILGNENKETKVLTIIQARMNASRLPDKPLLKIAGKPLLQHTVDGLEKVSNIDKVVVATSDTKRDDAIEDFCKKYGVSCSRGSEEDVLDRFTQAAGKFNPEYVIRICGDEPILDPKILEKAINEHIELNVDYSTTVHTPLYGAVPKGLDIEIVNYNILKELNKTIRSNEEREHVTIHILNNPEKFKIHKFKFDNKIARRDICLTVDTKDDLEFIEKIYLKLKEEKPENIAERIVEIYDNKIIERKPVILLRADASKSMGIGDVITIMHIADNLKDKYECIFASKNYPEGIALIKKKGYEVLSIERDITIEQEISEIKEYCKYKKIKYCIVQLTPGDSEYVKKLSEFLRTLIVDFHGNIEVYSDILLCWDLFYNENEYKIMNKEVTKLLGPKYAPIAKEFINYQKNKNSENLKKITVSLGGSDPHNIADKILKIASELKDNYDFTFVINEDFKNVNSEKGINFISSPEKIYEIFSESDLVISAGGFTSFELCAIGVPFIGISKIDWEVRRLKEMEELGICDFIPVDDNLKNNLFTKLKNLEDLTLRNNRTNKSKELVDGIGAQRIAEMVKSKW